MRDALETHEPAAPPTLDEVVARLGPISKGAEKLTALGYLDLGAEEAKGGGRRRRGRRRGAAEGGKTPRF
jgi:hypothetical protein